MTREEREHVGKVVALGCVACRNLGFEPSPAEAHHIRSGQGRMRASHFEVIPLCPTYHRTGPVGVAYHAAPKTWMLRHGTERELLAQTMAEVHEHA